MARLGFTSGAPAVAEASSGCPWARVHGCNESAAGKALCPGSAGSGCHPQGPRHGGRLNRTLAERLFGHQYAQEMRLPSGERSTG